MLIGKSIARDFTINSLGRVRLVGGTDALFQILFKFFETQFRSLAFKKVDVQFFSTLEAGVKGLTEGFIQSQRASINFNMFQGSEIVRDIVVNNVTQVDVDQFNVNLTVGLASGSSIQIPVLTRLA